MTDLQKRILDIFREVRDILDRNGITYFAIGGTCIGAVRHGGFIPWDDDLDIAVPIEQFGRMLDLLKAELPPHLELYTGAERKHYRYIFVKVTDNRTTFIEKTEIALSARAPRFLAASMPSVQGCFYRYHADIRSFAGQTVLFPDKKIFFNERAPEV